MGNGLAYLMLAIWPVVCLVLFRTQKVERALIWSILGGYLFLPPLTEFDLPLVPSMDKVSIPNLSVLLIMLFVVRHKVRFLPDSRLAQILVVGLILCAVPTVLTNTDPIVFQVLSGADPIVFEVDALPGQSLRDVGSVLIAQVLTVVPFLLARQFLSSEDGLREILLALMVGTLIYSIPSLIEIRLSPQINVWTYGFFQHSFAQTMRAGGSGPLFSCRTACGLPCLCAWGCWQRRLCFATPRKCSGGNCCSRWVISRYSWSCVKVWLPLPMVWC
ncbi:hypothetical protein ACFQDZ_06190 [Sulfitobacter pacificus]|uniref:hypothetical protein n=1 Tax=Sulfitobacter pacificus TaxID=1499314 RepID=UPI00361E37C9